MSTTNKQLLEEKAKPILDCVIAVLNSSDDIPALLISEGGYSFLNSSDVWSDITLEELIEAADNKYNSGIHHDIWIAFENATHEPMLASALIKPITVKSLKI